MSRVFFGGVPLKPDVEKLVERYGVPAEQAVIPYEDVSAVIGAPVKSYRFKTVTWVWRERLRLESNVLLRAWEGAFVACDPSMRVKVARAYVRASVRKARRGLHCAAGTDVSRLTEAERRVNEHALLTAAKNATADVGQLRRMALRPALPEAVTARRH